MDSAHPDSPPQAVSIQSRREVSAPPRPGFTQMALSPMAGISYMTERSPMLRGETPADAEDFPELVPGKRRPRRNTLRQNDVAGAFLSDDEAMQNGETTPRNRRSSMSLVSSPVAVNRSKSFPASDAVEISIDPVATRLPLAQPRTIDEETGQRLRQAAANAAEMDSDEERWDDRHELADGDDSDEFFMSTSKMQRPVMRFKKRRNAPSPKPRPIVTIPPSPASHGMFDPADPPSEPELEVHDFHAPGAEQGADADVHQPYLSHFRQEVEITVCDYASGNDHFEVQTVQQHDLDEFLLKDRPAWTKCRWINVEGGLSWDVIKVLALHYEIHPLAVEDLFHNSRIKADVYDKHLFISSVLLAIAPKSEVPRRKSTFNRSSDEHAPLLSPAFKREASSTFRGEDFFEGINATGVSRTNILNRNSSTAFLDARAAARNCEVTIEQVSMLLLRDRTVITFFQGKGGDIVTAPLYARLKQPLTLLRTSDDPSFLINSLMDALVDFMTPVVSFYDSEICRIEVRVLEAPKTLYTKQLHLIQAELNLLKRTVNQTQLLLQALAWRQGPLHEPGSRLNFISRTTRVYLNDVLDNCSTLVEMIDSLDRVSDDLINLIFNTLQFQVNLNMQQLSFVNIVFLPLTFLVGVYGMNFQTMPELQWEYGYLYFWILSLSIVVGLVMWFRSQQWNQNN